MMKIKRVFFLVPMSFFSCSLLSLELALENKNFSNYSCQDFIVRSQEEKFALKHLAGLKGLQKCAAEKTDYKYDLETIPAWQKRLFADEFPQSVTELNGNELSLDDLKLKVKNEKDPREKIILYKSLRQKLRNSGKRQVAINMSEDILKWSEGVWKKKKKDRELQMVYQEGLLIRARVLWNENKNEAALKLLKTGQKNLKTLGHLADFMFLEGRINEDLKNPELALSQYKNALAELEKQTSPPTLFDREKLMWIKAWMTYRNRQWIESANNMFELSEVLNDVGEKSRARFFQARSLENNAQYEEAKKIYELIISQDFYSFYALASYNRLGKKLPSLKSLTPVQVLQIDPELKFLALDRKNVFLDLIRMNEVDYAEKAIPYLSSNNYETFQLGLELAQKTQRFLPLFASFARLSNEEKMDAVSRFGDLLFPRLHEEEVKKMADKTEVSPSLIYAIMKQESAFNEKSRSASDAFGLMQVIPALAQSLSKKYNVPYGAPADLFNPIVNIQLGAFELRDQVQKQNGQLTFVAAAYNAGPNALLRWVKENSTEDMYEFIENIPYDETRSYVKIIARNKLFYERIRNKDKEHDFPSDFVTSLTSLNPSKPAQ